MMNYFSPRMKKIISGKYSDLPLTFLQWSKKIGIKLPNLHKIQIKIYHNSSLMMNIVTGIDTFITLKVGKTHNKLQLMQ